MYNLCIHRSNIGKNGHCLGSAESRINPPTNERSLSPQAICVIRAIMHSAFLWFSCYSKNIIIDLAHLVKPFVKLDDLSQFFWNHLQKDIEHLSLLTGKGVEDSAIIIHLILKEILTKELPPGKIGP